MKKNYMNALTHEFVSSENFMPVRDRSGNYALYENRHVLQFKQNNNIKIVEVLDGEDMNVEDIKRHCEKNVQWLMKISQRSAGKITSIFVFDKYPGIQKEEIITRFARNDYCLIITDMKSKESICEPEIFSNNSSINIVKKTHDEDLDNFSNLSATMEIIKIYNSEIMNELSHKKSKATFGIIGFTVFIYLIDYLVKQLTGEEIIKNFGIKQSFLITLGEYWRLITPMFLHADFMHLASNMFSLYILGETVEKYYGSKKLIIIYFVGGIMANVFSFTLTQNMSLGASGAVFSIGGAVVVLWKMKGSRLLRMSGKDLALVILIAINIILGFGNSMIDNWAHLGGLLGGILIAFGLGYKNNQIKKEYRFFAILIFVFLAAIVYYIGYSKWQMILSQYI